MKPAPFAYRAPADLADALAMLAGEADAVALAGGQSLVPELAARHRRPGVLVDLGGVVGLSGIRFTDRSVRVGAMTRLRALEVDAGLRARLPVLGRAAAMVAHRQIRHRATLGGSLCHADPAAELPAVALALDARLHLRSAGAVRVLGAREFFTGPFTTARRPDELLVEVELPCDPGLRFRVDEVTRRGAAGFPLVALCAVLRLDGPVDRRAVVSSAALAGAGVADRPVRLPGAEAALRGRPLADALPAARQALAADVDPPSDPHGDARYRTALLSALLGRVAALAHPGDGDDD